MTDYQLWKWKETIRERDGHRCTHCGMTEEEHQRKYDCALHVHRTRPGSEYSATNCETVCWACHRQLHRGDHSPVRLSRQKKLTFLDNQP